MHLDWLQSLYPSVLQVLNSNCPEDWPGLRQTLAKLLGESVIPEAALPLASCRAVGGSAEDAIPIAAAVAAAATSLRVMDDVWDQDRPGRLWSLAGSAQSLNYAFALQTLSYSILGTSLPNAETARRVCQCFSGTYLRMSSGQDWDLSGTVRTVDDYWAMVERKIACGYGAACYAGALMGTDDPTLLDACYDYGHHLGLVMQIVNDLQSIWTPEGKSDLEQGKVTLPLLYGLTVDHPQREELASIIESQQLPARNGRVLEILDHINVYDFLVWAALQERDQALEALKPCPGLEGREDLEAYVTGIFGDIDLKLSADKTTT